MFKKVGKKLESVAVSFCWIGICASVIGAMVLWGMNSYRNPTVLLGFVVLVVGCLVSWLGSLGCYALGQLTEDIHALRIASDAGTIKPKYDEAMRQKEAQQYAMAGALFSEIEAYDDAAEQAKECFYLLAKKQMQEGDYEKAIQSFEDIGNLAYRGANEWIKECWYQIGMAALNQKAYDKAQDAFINADDYEDAAEKILETSYRIAKDFLEKGEVEVAYEAFMCIEDYKDVRSIIESTPELQRMKQEESTEA